jgi:excisionase family DNA binding protein
MQGANWSRLVLSVEVYTPMSVSSPMSPPTLLDVRAVADRLGCSTKHVWRLRDRGEMPPTVELGSLRRWSSEAIDEWVRQGCPPHQPQQ